MTKLFFVALGSLSGSLVLTALVRAGARRIGAVAKPREDRWHSRPTALYGGVGIATTCVLSLGFVHGWHGHVGVLLAGSTAMFLLGLADDILDLRPQTKLVGQILGASLLLWFDIHLRWTGVPVLDSALTLFWVVGITNAVNLLDNMDGLAAGIVGIASGVMAFFFQYNHQTALAVSAVALCGAVAGFLVFNSKPASIFMGDCGSMFLGYTVAGLALLSDYGRARNLVPTLAVPVLVLLVPIFDTTFVTLRRKLAGRPISAGGRDHTSHRLVALGLSERQAVFILYGLSALGGALAILVRLGSVSTGTALMVPLAMVVLFVGIYLARERRDVTAGAPAPPGVVRFLADFAYKRRVFEVLLDVALVMFAYWAAHLLRYDSVLPAAAAQKAARALPLLVAVKLGTFLAMGLYRGVWRYTSLADVVTIGKSTVAASVLFVAGTFLAYRLDGIPRSIFVLDGMLCLLLVGGSRVSFRLIRVVLDRRGHSGGERVLIFGAGDGGELLLREINNNETLGMHPVGFVDDDARLRGKVIHGLRILGGREDIAEIVRAHGVRTILLSSNKIDVRELEAAFDGLAVHVRRFRISFADADRA